MLKKSFIPTYYLLLILIVVFHLIDTYYQLTSSATFKHFYLTAFLMLALKLIPLLLPVMGVIKLKRRALGWLGFILLMYFCIYFTHAYEIFPTNIGYHAVLISLYCILFIQILAIGKSQKKPK